MVALVFILFATTIILSMAGVPIGVLMLWAFLCTVIICVAATTVYRRY